MITLIPTLRRTAIKDDGRKRVEIQNVKPNVNCGELPVKRVTGEQVLVTADIISDGHDTISAELLYRKSEEKKWTSVRMLHADNDRWQGIFTVEDVGTYYYTLRAWVDHFLTWQKDLMKRIEADQDITVELLIGAEMIEKTAAHAGSKDDEERMMTVVKKMKDPDEMETATDLALSESMTQLMFKHTDRTMATVFNQEYDIWVERKRALFSSWYEFFPRSTGKNGSHGTFKDAEKLLPHIAELGFDVIYLPPIHPIGQTNRKGKNNSTNAKKGDPGSPWAIGSSAGGHKAVNPDLGTMEDFVSFVKKAESLGIETAIDIAYQCSPDHPYVNEHPEWFRWRPDGTVQYAENPPKKYQDVLPLNFETENWKELWEELKSVVEFWIGKGIKIFRVDNPHTKPFPFWEWLIKEIKKTNPEVIFLAEAFTRPKVMYRLGKVGFTQSYTYFTWRNTQDEFIDYLTELTKREAREFYRPNFWTNTPDILPENLQYGGRPAFITRLVLAATLSSNYGIYGPAYELCDNEAISGKEEYINSEKYEIKDWDYNKPGNITDIVKQINRIRKENEALHTTYNIEFYHTDNKYLLCYGKVTDDLSNILLVVVNLDYYHKQRGSVQIPIESYGIPERQSYLVHELLHDNKFMWMGGENIVELDPEESPAFIFKIHRRLRRENDFDYFM